MSRTVRKIDPTRYKRLLSRTMPVVIESEEENERMLAIVAKLMDKGEDLSPEEEKILKLFARLIEDFEQRYYHPREATPLEVLQHLMEARGVKQTHLWEVFRLERHCFRSNQRQTRDQQDSGKGPGKLLSRFSRLVYLI